jgi:hypothetical protein
MLDTFEFGSSKSSLRCSGGENRGVRSTDVGVDTRPEVTSPMAPLPKSAIQARLALSMKILSYVKFGQRLVVNMDSVNTHRFEIGMHNFLRVQI